MKNSRVSRWVFLDLVGCFCLRLSNSWGGHVDPGRLFVGFQVKSLEQRCFEEAFIKTI
jgi:hypothetical protein